jgi:hypothetical protein
MDTTTTDIIVNVYGSGAAASRANLTNICLVSTGSTHTALEVNSYYSYQDVLADTLIDAPTRAIAAQFFALPVHPPVLKIAAMADYTTFETSLAAILQADPDIFAFVTPDRTKANLIEFAAACATVHRLGLVQAKDAAIYLGTAANLALTIQAALNPFCGCVYHDDDACAVDLAALGYKLALSPDDGSCNFDKTALVGQDLAAGVAGPLNATEWGFITTADANSIVNFGGVPVFRPGTLGSGDFIDTAISKLWAETRLREALAQRFISAAAANEKIPYNAWGIAQLEGVARKTLELGCPPNMRPQAAHFNPGSVYVTAPTEAAQTAALKLTRVLPAFTCGAVLSGAIQSVTFNVFLPTA